jgi:hypothetical protein
MDFFSDITLNQKHVRSTVSRIEREGDFFGYLIANFGREVACYLQAEIDFMECMSGEVYPCNYRACKVGDAETEEIYNMALSNGFDTHDWTIVFKGEEYMLGYNHGE